MKNLRDTKIEYIGNKIYCSFCGKEAQSEYEYDQYDKTTYHFCDCEASQLYLQIKDMENKLNEMTDRSKLNILKYNEEIKSLKRKYEIEN